MSKKTVFLAFLAGFILFGGSSQAGLISFNSSEPSNWSAEGVEILQDFSVVEPLLVDITAEAHSDFNISATITNRSNITWTGYILSLDPQGQATFVQETAGSTMFRTTLYPDLWTIEFRAPEPVLPGQAVTLNFDINIPDNGSYSFTLTQNPIPEPATVILFALGGVFLIGRNTKRQDVS